MIMKELQIAKSDRDTRKKRGKKIYSVPYEPAEPEVVKVWVLGEEIVKMRVSAGFDKQGEFAAACGWTQQVQSKYELRGDEKPPALGRNKIALDIVCKMIRVCNGGQ